MGAENWDSEHVETLLQVDGVDENDVKEIVEEYSYPGELYHDLHYDSIVEGVLDLDLDVDHGLLYRELSRAGVSYYTGRPEPKRPDPPDIFSYSGPDMDRIRYQLLGREQGNGYCHFYRAADDLLEVLVFEQDFEGSLDRQNVKRFGHSPVPRLQHYVEEREWDILREPDYEDMDDRFTGKGGHEVTDSVESCGQSTWNQWMR